MRGSIPFSGAKINKMIRFEIEYYENIREQTKLLKSIAKSLETIANEQERKRRESSQL